MRLKPGRRKRIEGPFTPIIWLTRGLLIASVARAKVDACVRQGGRGLTKG